MMDALDTCEEHPAALWHLQFTESQAWLGTSLWCGQSHSLRLRPSETQGNKNKSQKPALYVELWSK